MNFVRHLKKQYLIKYEESELVRNVFANTYIFVLCFRRAKESDYFLAIYRKFDDLLYVYTLINVI